MLLALKCVVKFLTCIVHLADIFLVRNLSKDLEFFTLFLVKSISSFCSLRSALLPECIHLLLVFRSFWCKVVRSLKI